MVQAPVALRVDVDTRRGLHDGVPRLLALFRRLDVVASFFVTMGPDRSGLAIRRAWRPSFLVKMFRTNPFRLYGVRTLLSGTLLPAQPVGASAPALLRDIAGALSAALCDGLNVFTLHAEVEGGPLLEPFSAWLEGLRRGGRSVVRVRDVANAVLAGPVCDRDVSRGHVAGRSGWVAVTGEA